MNNYDMPGNLSYSTCRSGWASIAFLFASVSFSQTASFDCGKAVKPYEKQICSTPKLAKLDRYIASAYSRNQSLLSPESFALVQAEQRSYLIDLGTSCRENSKDGKNATQYIDCLFSRMERRFKALQVISLGNGSALFASLSGNDNGWRLDRPTALETQWLALLRGKMASFQREDATELRKAKQEGKADGLDTSDYDVSSNVFLDAANERLICMTIDRSESMGGAHPSGSLASWNYWLDKGHDVVAADVFRPESNWKALVARLLVQDLEAQGSGNDEMEEGVRKGLKPDHWTLTNQGLTVQFGLYEVGAYADGTPSVTLPWSALQRVLQPDLHPKTLPDSRNEAGGGSW